MGDRGGVPLPEEQKAEQVHDGIALRPPEVAVWRLASGVAEVEQEGGDGVGHHRAFCAQHLVVADLYAAHLQHVGEFGGVFYLNFEEEDRHAVGYVVVFALLLLLSGVLFGIGAPPTPVRDDVDLAPVGRLAYEPSGRFVYLYPLLAQLGRAIDPRSERGENHRDDEEGGDQESVRPLYLIRGEGVDEHEGDQAERQRRRSRTLTV